MIVIGGKHSSNTQKLYEICQKECKNTYYIQTLGDLNPECVEFCAQRRYYSRGVDPE